MPVGLLWIAVFLKKNMLTHATCACAGKLTCCTLRVSVLGEYGSAILRLIPWQQWSCNERRPVLSGARGGDLSCSADFACGLSLAGHDTFPVELLAGPGMPKCE